ncbi:MAG: relaxase domain-containing protein [Trebonia sp.]
MADRRASMIRKSGRQHTAARRYLEADRSQADDYYLEHGTALAAFTITDSSGAVIAGAGLDPEQYAAWVDWTHPLTGEQMGTPRLPGVPAATSKVTPSRAFTCP